MVTSASASASAAARAAACRACAFSYSCLRLASRGAHTAVYRIEIPTLLPAPVSDRFSVLPQYIIPKQALTSFAGWVSSRKRGRVTTEIVRRFVLKYQVNMDEAVNADIASYLTFNDFFTRALKPGARPIASADLVSPVDGAISQFGPITGDQIVQAKGHNYSITAVVGGDPVLAAQYEHGSFATLYLSPKDYHRIHMPCDGLLKRMIYVPGDLFSVNPLTARGVPGLFARNERVVCVFESERGPFVLILVGATIVGSMATVWHGVVNPPRGKVVRSWDYPSDRPAIAIKKGEEMGRFLLGSTVVMLFPEGPLKFNPEWAPGRAIRLGEAMANYA
ncbi:MAG: Phosphatidylserine decarboxylase [Polaromonas sp.]|nr:Phosphatidylserine decarboxylase [Polaromonas sp.]